VPGQLPIPLPRQLRDATRKKINRAPSPGLAKAVPWLLVMLGSLSPTWPIVASAPVLPPVGFLFLIAWQQLRPGLFPIWAGLPLGLFDDLFSGQPFGSAVLLWSLAMIAIDVIETRFSWLGFAQDWLAASAIITVGLILALAIANAGGSSTTLAVIAPQLIVSILIYPLAGRVTWLADRFRLLPIREL
jgi:rod shape-determining protein MreD